MYQSILEGRVPDANTQPTFLFADIAGFTALTEAHGDAEQIEAIGSAQPSTSPHA
jgi:class 3 adenylate cyclase